MIDPYPGQSVVFLNAEGGTVTAEVVSITHDEARTAWDWRTVRLRFDDVRCHEHAKRYRDLYMWAFTKCRVR